MIYDDRLVRSAQQLTKEIRVVDHQMELPRAPSITYDAEKIGRAGFGIYTHSRMMRNYVIEDAIVNFRFRIAHKDSFAIYESLYGIDDGELLRTRPTGETYVAELKNKTAIYAFVWTATNFYHWLMQILTSIETVLTYRDAKDVVIITADGLNHWQEASLKLLGYGGIDRFVMEKDRYYQVPRLEISDFCNAPTFVTRTGLQVCKKLKVAAVTGASKGRKLYVSRQDANMRQVINEPELIDLLSEYGIESLLVGSMTLQEQIQTFHEASFVMGPHGQGMAHAAYCNEGTYIWEMFPEHFITDSTVGIAATLGLRYHATGFKQILSGESSQVTDFEIDLDIVRSKLHDLGMSKIN